MKKSKTKITFPPDDYISQFDRLQNYTPLNDYTVEKIRRIDFPRQLSAAISKRKTKVPTLLQYMNTYLGLDTALFQDAYLNTITGSIIDFLSWVVIGKGIEPVLVLKNPEKYGDEKSQRKEIAKDESILSKLKEIDDSIGESKIQYDHSFLDKMKGLLKTTLCYGRGSYVKIPKGESYNLIQLHPRDMVYNYVDPKTLKLHSIQTTVAYAPYFMDELIYAEYNPENPSYRNMFFGFSLQQRMLGSARTLKRIHDVDMQLFAQKRWAGSSIIAVAEAEGKDMAATLTKKLKAGEVMMFNSSDPENAVSVYEIPLPTDTNSLIEMSKYLVNYCLGVAGIPPSLFFDENSANYATLIGKMRAFLNGPIAEYRKWFGDIIAKQWYMPNFEGIAGSELFKKYRIEVKFSDIEFESPEEKSKLLETINRLGFALKPESVGEIFGIDNFEFMIDDSREAKKDEGYSIEKSDGTTDTMRPLSAAKEDTEKGRWITVRGTHIFVPEDKSVVDVLEEKFGDEVYDMDEDDVTYDTKKDNFQEEKAKTKKPTEIETVNINELFDTKFNKELSDYTDKGSTRWSDLLEGHIDGELGEDAEYLKGVRAFGISEDELESVDYSIEKIRSTLTEDDLKFENAVNDKIRDKFSDTKTLYRGTGWDELVNFSKTGTVGSGKTKESFNKTMDVVSASVSLDIATWFAGGGETREDSQDTSIIISYDMENAKDYSFIDYKFTTTTVLMKDSDDMDTDYFAHAGYGEGVQGMEYAKAGEVQLKHGSKQKIKIVYVQKPSNSDERKSIIKKFNDLNIDAELKFMTGKSNVERF